MPDKKQHNFGAGPCILPDQVTSLAAKAVGELDDLGLSVLEISHRSDAFAEILSRTERLVRELLEVPEDYSVLFMQGGASSQFDLVPMNFLQGSGKRALYHDSGFFALKAIAEARHFGEVEVVGSSADLDYNDVRLDYAVPPDAVYLHLTSNNTIEGTQMMSFAETSVPLVCDMSSDIFTRKIEVSKFALIYAGAQKNLGPAGLTLVIARNSFLDSGHVPLPSMFDYRTFREHGSLYNTPPVFSIYTAMLNLLWMRQQGGLEKMQALSAQKAKMLYDAIDRSEIFYGLAEPSSRSLVNVTFALWDPHRTETFLRYAGERGIVGIKGYPTRGGLRVSLYNGLPLSSVEVLCKTMEYFQVMERLKGKLASLERMESLGMGKAIEV